MAEIGLNSRVNCADLEGCGFTRGGRHKYPHGLAHWSNIGRAWSDRNPEPVDPNFEGYAVTTSDAEGRYRFKTIKPGAYPQDSGQIRAPHIHFDVAGRKNRLVTQMYFPGEPLNNTDAFLQVVGPNISQLLVTLRPPRREMEPGALLGEWDIVLDEG